MTTPAESSDALPYRPCVGIALISPSGGVFVGRRRADAGPEHVAGPHRWQMPQGGVDPGEDPEAAARRELFEETNVPGHALRFLAEIPEWLPYDLPPAVMKAAWKGRYRGQTQRWFSYGFTGPEALIDVASPGDGAYKAEFDAWRWARFDELPELIVPFKRPVYERVAEAFAPLATWAARA
ncbi:RNA pyrophosphohydrolase [Methylobacterium sp. NEAU 140]|uniref:RNA pyrophosphohydrolase n=1 Tax=Methylobacterium sp. NEAU 140 TaxID=3064945 RepID=UPI0027363A5A|nr:RNA pyrophosphohydrolase [Methylobacterium sp. NEAU 140]MDP4023061.1 RNA pyrophosphohydrolase [Methylobacterium sp. NEAU 140]